MNRPAVLDELYGDLRDRKLLPIIALLVIAIIAVPVVLSVSSSGSDSGAAPVAEIVPADAPEAQAAVLAENPGLRDYRQRLDALKAKNPFKQQYAIPDDAAATGGDLASTDSGGVTPPGDATSAPGSSSTGAVTGSTGASAGSTGPTIDTTVDNTSDTAGIDVTPSKPQFYSFRVDVQYGVDGDVSKHKNVKVLDILSPVGAFLGASENGDRAFFTMSSDIVGADGEGECIPAPDDCGFLTLEKGQSETLAYQSATATEPSFYRLAVDNIRLVKVKKPQGVGE